MQPFSFDRAVAERSLPDPDGALWPVNAYSDADELDSLVQAALDSGAIAATEHRARLYVYPLSLSEPDPLLAVDTGRGPTVLGHSLKLVDREGESPVDFTLRLLEDLTAEANRLSADAPPPSSEAVPGEELSPRCPDCCSEGTETHTDGASLRCGNCGTTFHREQALVTVAEAEARASCTCSDVRGCPQCFDRAERLVGVTVRDDQGREWEVAEADEKDGFPTVGDDDCWARLSDVEVIG